MLAFVIGARKDTDTEEFRRFKRTLIHRSIMNILLPIKPFMTTPDVVLCPDQYFRRVLEPNGSNTISGYLLSGPFPAISCPDPFLPSPVRTLPCQLLLAPANSHQLLETPVRSFLVVCHTFTFVTCDLFYLSLVSPLCFRLFCDVT